MSLPVHLAPDLAGARPDHVVVVEGDEAHHAVAVRRLREGEPVVLTDGLGTVVSGTVSATGRRRFEVTVATVKRRPRAAPSFTVVQALPKGDRGELAVEVLTEVGVDRIVPWAAARSVAVWRGERVAKSLARWRATAREAAKQARRSWFPQVADLSSTAQVCALVAAADLAVVLHEGASEPLAALAPPGTRGPAVVGPPSTRGEGPGEVLVVVGPEGGLTDAEVEAFVGSGAHAVHLGSEVLRTSTAGLAAVAALLARTPRWLDPS